MGANSIEELRKPVAWAALLYLLFVVYGSLIPFAFTDRPLDQALGLFMPPQWIRIGATDRADWIANALLYMPLAYLCLEAGCAGARGSGRVGRAVVVLASIALLAIGIEFAQLFFPPRTVSLNDLAAEGVGIVVGALAWVVAGNRLRTAVVESMANRFHAGQALAAAAVLAYLVLMVFPFDFVVSLDELAARFRGPAIGLWLAPLTCSGVAACVGRAGLETVAGAAFGAAWYWRRRTPSRVTPGGALRVALAFSVGIEFIQLFLVSGVAQGASVIARALGIALGYLFAAHMPRLVAWYANWQGLRVSLRVGWVVYVTALFATTRILGARVASVQEAWARLGEIQLMPFYYHYYVSEQWALLSAGVQLAMYAPVGGLIALARLGRSPDVGRSGLLVVLTAALLALLVEAGKLFAGRRPDPTDLLFAMAGSYLAFRAVSYFLSVSVRSPAIAEEAFADLPRPRPLVAFGPLTVLGGLMLLAATLGLLRYPLPAMWLAVALAAYGLALLRWPGAWLVVLPALLPVLDLSPWTGWLFLDEFDLFVMVTIAALSVVPRRDAPARYPRGLKLLLGAAAALAVLALFRGLLPFEELSPDMFWGLHRHVNALRPARAVLWAMLLLVLVRHWSEGPARDLAQLARGLTLGLIGAGLIVIWERTTFAGFLDFGWDYRAVGAFSAASTAGAQLESFLAAAMPFAALLAMRRGAWPWRVAGIAALAVGAYAVAATISRTALLGAAVGLIALAVGVIAGKRLHPALSKQLRPGLVLMAVLGTVAVVATAALVSGRFATAGGDLQARRAHWTLAAGISGSDAAGALLGAGFGTFPASYLWHGPMEKRPALFSYRREQGRSYVRVSPGTGTFLDQIVKDSGSNYTLRARIRSLEPDAIISFALCEKWILYSSDCRHVSMRTARSNEWETQETRIASPAPSRQGGFFRPVIKFAVNGGSVKATVDVTDLALIDGSGNNVLANGGFSHGGTRWFLSADDNWSWNISNLFVELLFEQGWLGLLAFLWLLGYALALLANRALRGDPLAAASVGALLGFLVPACFDSVIDDPRMRLLLFLLIAVPLLLPGKAGNAGPSA